MSYPQEKFDTKIHFNHGKRWTKEDIEYLIKFYNYDDNSSLEYSLGRTKKTIANKYWEIKNKKEM